MRTLILIGTFLAPLCQEIQALTSKDPHELYNFSLQEKSTSSALYAALFASSLNPREMLFHQRAEALYGGPIPKNSLVWLTPRESLIAFGVLSLLTCLVGIFHTLGLIPAYFFLWGWGLSLIPFSQLYYHQIIKKPWAVVTKKASLQSGISRKEDSTLFWLPENTPVFLEKKKKDWYLVRSLRNEKGWIHSGFLLKNS